MSYQITDLDELNIYITFDDGEWYVPKFRIYMVVEEPICYLYWTDSEKGTGGFTRMLPLNYNDVQFGYLTPTSASEVRQVIEGYQISAFPSLSGYVPYTGATGSVDLGIYGLTTDFVAFSQTPTTGPGNAQIGYNGQTQALAYDFDSTNVRCNIGQQMYAYVKNDDAVTITKGQAVYLFGASGNKATVKLADNSGDSTSATTLGLAAEDIASGQNGLVITQGVLDGLNTLAYAPGDILYLGSTPGGLTPIKPYAPDHLVYIGVVEKSNAGNGQILVRPQNGYELNEIHDVDLITTPPSAGDVLTYDGTLWVNQAPVSGTGTVTSIATTSPITGGPITTTGTIGINNAAANGSTKGAAAFTASDFNDNGSGVISIDYTNGQAASGSNKGFLTSADWTTFNGKQDALVSGTNIKTIDGTSALGSGNVVSNYTLQAMASLGSTIKAITVGCEGVLGAVGSGGALANQRVVFTAVYLPQATTLTGVKFYQVAQGVYTANNYNGVGLYTYNGSGTLTLVASSTNDGNIWKGTANSWQTKAFASTYSASAGLYFVGVLYCQSAQTTAPSIGIFTNANNNYPLFDFTNSAKLYGQRSTLTALPTPQLMSGVSGFNQTLILLLY